MKKAVFATIGVLIILLFYLRHNYNLDKQNLLKIISTAANGKVKEVLDIMNSTKSLSNPIVNFTYQRWKKRFYSRFVDKDEIIATQNTVKVLDDISNIYRSYWIKISMKEKESAILDSLLETEIGDYLIRNNLTAYTSKNLKGNIFPELERVIQSQGANSNYFYINQIKDIVIWDKQSEEKYGISLPNDTIKITVVFIENYVLKGYIDFVTFGSSQTGGWPINSQRKLYCNKAVYKSGTEKFRLSYLKHEANHFVDIQKYPNLSAADLEYRSKLIEIIYSKNEIQDRLSEFIAASSTSNRSNSHAYANYWVISNLSRTFFNSAFESDINKWKNLTAEKLNQAATNLLLENEKKLANNSELREII